jgi:hypothetical protein
VTPTISAPTAESCGWWFYRVAITGIHADAAGDDRRNLNGEYMLVRNTGAVRITLSG